MSMVQTILRECEAKSVLCLTGTPPPFVLRGVKMHSHSMYELHKEGHCADVHVQLAVSDFAYRNSDYTDTGELSTRAARRIKTREIRATMDHMLRDLAVAIAAAHGKPFLASRSERQTWADTLRAAHKTMIVCQSQRMARTVHKYFADQNIHTLISISDIEGSTPEIEKFKTYENERVLVVVNRGALGFDYPGMMTLVDLTGTRNINRIFQMLGRVARKNDRAARGKLYFKVVSPAMVGIADLYVHAALALSFDHILRKWNGENLNGMEIFVPKDRATRGADEDSVVRFESSEGAEERDDLDDVHEEIETAESGERETRTQAKERKKNGVKRVVLPPGGFFWNADYFEGVNEARAGKAGKGGAARRSVRGYVKTTLGRALAKMGARRLSAKETRQEMIEKYNWFMDETGHTPKVNGKSEHERHLAHWMHQIVRYNEKTLGYPGKEA